MARLIMLPIIVLIILVISLCTSPLMDGLGVALAAFLPNRYTRTDRFVG
jgi:hypothetical protein